jgi:hypothetical protein
MTEHTLLKSAFPAMAVWRMPKIVSATCCVDQRAIRKPGQDLWVVGMAVLKF